LLDINEFYSYTLDDKTKSVETKTEETCQLAEKWESHSPPVPSEKVDLARRTLDDEASLMVYFCCCGYMDYFRIAL